MEKWGCLLKLEFLCIKIMDYKKKQKFLFENKNPFAMVILIQLAAIEAGNNNDLKLKKKCELIQIIYKRYYNEEDIIKLSRFLDGLFILPKLYKLEYHKTTKVLEGEIDMSYLSSFEEMGITIGEGRVLKKILEYKFKQIPERFLGLIDLAEDEELLEWSVKVFNAKNIEEVFV